MCWATTKIFVVQEKVHSSSHANAFAVTLDGIIVFVIIFVDRSQKEINFGFEK
ncbi:unnamed protein product [Tenebrio molitor]|jgi:hypothetical protein|nr:unnamed protein product [Tenebrio molitor]